MLELRLENYLNDNGKIGNVLIENIISAYKGQPAAIDAAIFFTLMTAFESAIRPRKANVELMTKLKKYTQHEVVPTLFGTFSAAHGQKAVIYAADKANKDTVRDVVKKRLMEDFRIDESDFSNFWVNHGEMRIRSEVTKETREVVLASTYIMCDEDRNVCESLGWTAV